jgi:hypothetical protein
MATLGSLSLDITANSATLLREIDRSNRAVGNFAKQAEAQTGIMNRGFTAVGTAAKAAAAGIAGLVGALGAREIVQMSKAALDAAGNLGELATRAGVSTRELQALQVAGVQVGVETEQMTTALAQFGVRVGEARQGTGELADVLTRHAIATADSAGQVRSSVAILEDLADAVQRAGSAQEQLSIVADAFGSRVGPRLLPLLAEGADGFRQWAEAAEAAGLILDDELVAAADRASDQIATLQFAVAKGFEIGVVKEFADAVSITAEQLNQARAAGEAFGRVVGQAMAFVTDAMRSLEPFLRTTVREFKALAALLESLFSAIGVPFAFAAEAEEASAAIGPLVVDIHKIAPAADAAAASTKRLADAYGDLTTTFRNDVEADLRLRQNSAAQNMEERLREQEKLNEQFLAGQRELSSSESANLAQQAMATAADDLEDRDGAFAAKVRELLA